MEAKPGALVLGAFLAALLVACSGGDQPGTPDIDEATQPLARRDVPEKYRGFTSELYAVDENWMCRPDIPAPVNDCLRPNLDTTVIHSDGRLTVVPSLAVVDAPVDCFYIYPTIPGSTGATPNDLDMAADKRGEVAVLTSQFARFREVCNVYAPLYRQVRLSAFGTAEGAAASALAYGDVRDAFKHYMAHFNQGRPFILIGHSQGAGHLNALIRQEIDPDPDLRSRMVSAYLIGGRVGVPPGEVVGGDFQNIPLCQRADQTGCVVAYVSYAASAPPGPTDLFGRTSGGTISACVNPAAPSGGKAPLTNYASATGIRAPGGQTITTPYVSMPGVAVGECVQRGGFTYLEIGVAENDPRDGTQVVRHVAGWGLHLSEVNLTMGDLLELVRTQSKAFRWGQ